MAMPGYVPSLAALVSKLVSLFPHNASTAIPTHQAVIAVFDAETGSPAALPDGTEITAVRTGACSALSARLLAREDASVLAVLGTGVQARSHARALVRVRPIRELRIAGRDPAKARALAAEMGRELDDQTVADALVCVESRRAVLAPIPAGSNDLVEPIRAGVISEDHIHAELGELLSGTRPGRSSPEQITLYKSVGVAVQDAAAATLVLAAARERGVGRELQI